MKQFIQPKPLVWNSILSRPTASFKDLEPVIEDVFSEVQSKGDEALKAYTQKFDGVSLDSFSVTEADFLEAENKVSKKLKEAIQLAKSNIEAFHKAQKTPSVSIETQPGVCVGKKKDRLKKWVYIFLEVQHLCFLPY